jgi:hypothetical protein
VRSIATLRITFAAASILALTALPGVYAVAQTAAPAASVDPSKLPDVEGIHLGMSAEQASAIMKGLFPAGTHSLTVTAARFANTQDKVWLTSMTGSLASNCTGCSEQVILRFSTPPRVQQVF